MAISGKEVALVLSDRFDANEFNGLHSCLSKESALISTVGETAGQKLSDADRKTQVDVEVSYEEGRSYNFDAVVIFDGYSPDITRMDEDALAFILDMYNSGKIIGAIDHGAQVLINLEALKGKNVTGSPSIRVDLENAGARYFDEPVVIDGNLVTGRGPQDLEDFCQAIVDELRRLTEFAA
ncbi:MAG: DJ-1/PfpI family protein [Candidatus Aquicultor sp.]